MADEPKPESATTSPADTAADTPAASAPPETQATPDAAATKADGAVPNDPLTDGTVPTVLNPGQTHRVVPKSKASLNTIYRRADILTSLLAFAGAAIASVAIFFGYSFFAKGKSADTKPPTKVTQLDKTELEKLGAFFDGNSAGTSGEVLTISSSSLFKNRVAVNSDFKVVGGAQISGDTTLAGLNVDKTTNLGVTNVRGALGVAGPLNLQSPATLSAGANVTGNLAVSGNGSFGGSLSAGTLNIRDLSVTGTLNLAGHLSIAGQTPSVAGVSGVSSGASVEGNDSSGVILITVGPTSNQPLGAQIATLTFKNAYPRAPHVVITPIGRGSALLQPYVLVTATGFTIGAATLAANASAAQYAFSYWVVQ